MKSFRIAVAVLSFICSSVSAQFNDCRDQFPNGVLPTLKQHGRDLCFNSFAVFYSPDEKKPIYVVERLNRRRLQDAVEERTNQFYEEARLRGNERALLTDYLRSGWDRGHNAPAADMPNSDAMAQSFSLANMMPQASENNRGIWAKAVERATRQYVLRRARGDVFVYTGSVGEITRIGSGRVVVPANLFKLVYDQERGEAWVYWVENTNTAKMSAPVTYSEIKKLTGIDFNLPVR